MKTLKIYCFLTTIIVIVLSSLVFFLIKELKETNEVLDQCSERYYEEIGVLKKIKFNLGKEFFGKEYIFALLKYKKRKA